MKVIVIREENHGLIGVAKNMKSAFRFLVEKGWIDELWDKDTEKYVDPYVLLKKYNIDNLLDLLTILYIEDDNIFDEMFYFSETEVFEWTNFKIKKFWKIYWQLNKDMI